MENNQTRLPYFKEASLREELLSKSEVKAIPANTVILEEGAYVKLIPIVLDGRVRVVKLVEEKEVLLYYIYPDESCIMSIASSFENEKSKVKAITEEESEILLVPSQYFSQWRMVYPSLNDFIIQLYKTRFENILDAFNAVAFQSADDRLITYLRKKAEDSPEGLISTTHQAIADELGMARETISRLLKKLEHDDQIELSRGHIRFK